MASNLLTSTDKPGAKGIRTYLFTYDATQRSYDFMKGLLTGYPKTIVEEFVTPWEGLFIVKSPISPYDLTMEIRRCTGAQSFLIMEVTKESQGMLERNIWEFMGEQSKSPKIKGIE